MNTSWNTIRAITIGALCFAPVGSNSEPMTGEEIKRLYASGATECGEYFKDGKRIPYCEYWHTDGTIIGKDYMRYRGSYRIKTEEGIVCVKYGSNKETCAPYEHKSGNIYTVMYEDGSHNNVTIKRGNTKNLK